MLVPKTREVIELVPPDGGWGWMVLLGVALNNVFNVSLYSAYGLIYGDAIERMGHQTQGAALVLNTSYFVAIFGGPIAGALVKLTSDKMVAIYGACLCSLGILLSGFSTQLWHLLFTFGIMFGLGFNFVIVSSFVTVNSYFKVKKNRAVSLYMVGPCLGQILLPHLVRYLLEIHGYRNACIVLGSLNLLGALGCFFIQPVERHMKEIKKLEIIEEPDLILESKHHDIGDHTGSISIDMYNIPIDVLSTPNENVNERQNGIFMITRKEEKLSQPEADLPKIDAGATSETKPSLLWKLNDLFALSLMCNIRFMNILMGIALSTVSIINFSMIYPLFLEKDASLNKQQIANCMCAIAVSDLMSRFILPIFYDKYRINSRLVVIMTVIWLIVVTQVLAHQTKLDVLFALSILYGFGRNVVIIHRNIIIADNCKKEQIPSAVGLDKSWTGLVALPVGYLLGWIRDYTDSFVAGITAQNALMFIVLLTWIPDMIHLYKIKNKDVKEIRSIT